MSERFRNLGVNQTNSTKMGPDIGPKKTMIVLVIVVGCFAVLWPKVFYPMLQGNANQHMKPSPIDKTTGCCDVFSEKDMTTIKIMTELCSSINQPVEGKALSEKQIITQCRTQVLKTCGIDIAAVLQEQVRLGASVKQIINEVRSLNGSLCLKYNFGVAPWRLGVEHRQMTNFKQNYIRQERPPHMRAEIMHPAFRERGSAITPSKTTPPRPAPPKILEGRPGPVPGMRPPMGGAGHVVPPSQKGSSMGIIMPLYTIGIVVFFTYTLMKLIFKKQPDGVGGVLYPPVLPDPNFRREVFESEKAQLASRSKEAASKIVVNAMSALLDEVDEEIEARKKASEVEQQVEPTLNGTISNGSAVKTHKTEDRASVKIVGMETTASSESGQKWSRPPTPIIESPVIPTEPIAPPHEIFLEGALPAKSQLLVSDAKTETEDSDLENEAVVLAGKMTLSLISLDLPREINSDEEEIEEEIEEIEIEEEIDEIHQNGDEDEPLEESKYTTASCNATAAEIAEISDEEDITDEELDLNEEIIVNHTKHESDSEE